MFTEFSDKKIFVFQRARTCHLLCKRQGCYHSTTKTHVRDRIFKFEPNSYFSDLSDFLNLVKSRKTLVKLLAALKTLVICFGQLYYSRFYGKDKICFNLLEPWSPQGSIISQNDDFEWNKSSWVNDW